MRKWIAKGIAAAALLSVFAILAAVASTKVRLRAELLALWARGSIRDISRRDLKMLLRPGGKYDLRLLIASRDPYVALRVPRADSADLAGGAALFRQACASCHGAEATGKVGPALVRRTLAHGETDWALYRNISGGIPGTGMPAAHLSSDDIWRVIAYVRDLQANGQAATAPAHMVTIPDTRAVLESPDANRQNWLTYSGTYSGQRFSPLSDISTRTVERLRVEWLYQLQDASDVNEATPLVAGNVLLVTDPYGVTALDVDSGATLW